MLPLRLALISNNKRIKEVLPVQREHVPIFFFFFAIVDCPSHYPRPALAPSAVFFSLDRAAGCMVWFECLTSLRVQTFFGIYKQPRQPREAFVDYFPACINIYQPGKHRHMSAMRQCLRVARWRAGSCLGLKCDPKTRFVVLKHSVRQWNPPHTLPVWLVHNLGIPR